MAVAETAFETVACPLCGCADATIALASRDLLYRQPGEFNVVCCSACGHAYLNPRPTPDAIGRYYPADYAPFRLEQAGGDASSSRGRVSRWLRAIPGLHALVLWLIESRAQYVPSPMAAGSRALELGCADGAFLKQLEQLGWKAQGIEPSPAAASVARSRGLEVQVGTLESASLASGQFDAVFAWMVLEHLHEPRETLAEIHRVLKPGGWLAFCVPNFGCWERHVFGRYWYALQLPTHLQHFTPRPLRKLLDDSGFEVVEMIHQRNLSNVVGSFGLMLRTWFPGSRLGERLIRFTDNPNALGLLLLSPFARLMALLRQGGRLTVAARRREAPLARSGEDA
jgi:SAM-dependent methyltransferase